MSKNCTLSHQKAYFRRVSKPLSMCRRYPVLLFFLFLSMNLKAQDPTTPQSLFQYFSGITDSIPLLVLDTDVRNLIKLKRKENYQPTSFTFRGPDGEWISLMAKVRARGNMRKQVCYFPPLKINLKTKDLEKLQLDQLDKLKLVFQCWDNKRGYELIHREQLLYRLHEIIGPVSYKTTLVRVQLGDKYEEPHYAFLIEEESEFKQRLNGPIVEKGHVRTSMIDREAYLRMCFFQYLILNTDWYMHNLHNLEFIMPEGKDKLLPVPYDFDYAGLVDASYAVPHSSRNIKDVKEPCYLCKSVTEEEALRMATFFQEKKSALYQTVQDYPYLDEKVKSIFTDRLDTFFKELENERSLKRVFVNE